MATQLQVVQRVQAIIAAMDGIGRGYDYPPESINDEAPVYLVYPGDATVEWSDVQPLDEARSYEVVVIELLWPRAKELPDLMAAAYAWFNTVPKALYSDATLNGDATTTGMVHHISKIARRFPFQRSHSTVTAQPTIDHMGIQWLMYYRLDVDLT